MAVQLEGIFTSSLVGFFEIPADWETKAREPSHPGNVTVVLYDNNISKDKKNKNDIQQMNRSSMRI